MPSPFVAYASLLLVQAALAQSPAELAKLGWYEAPAGVVTERAFGGVGAGVAIPSHPDGLRSFEALALLKSAGTATFATARHPGLPFDLAAARLVDGLVITDGEADLALWSMLLDHGYPTAPIAGAGARLFIPCPAGFSAQCLTAAVKQQQTVVSTGPLLVATMTAGQPLQVKAWSALDRLLRIELWAHQRVIATRILAAGEQQHFSGTLAWTPSGVGDWVAVRVVSEHGWALSSAFFAAGTPRTAAVTTHLKMVFPELASQQQAGALVTIWDRSPALPGAQRLHQVEMERNELELDAPVTAVVRIELADGRRIDTSLFEATGVPAVLAGATAPLAWPVFEEVLRRCRQVSLESRF